MANSLNWKFWSDVLANQQMSRVRTAYALGSWSCGLTRPEGDASATSMNWRGDLAVGGGNEKAIHMRNKMETKGMNEESNRDLGD
jgi:hypothetical protein